MKKLLIAALLVVGMTTFAQVEKKAEGKRAKMEQFTPEQRNELRLKKMTLELDLNASQQKEIAAIIKEQDAKREAMKAEHKALKDGGKKMTSDERFAMKSKMLDDQKVMKDRMKKILNPEQFKKWEDMKEDMKENMKEHRMDGKMKQ